jgi:hypothetical protein
LGAILSPVAFFFWPFSSDKGDTSAKENVRGKDLGKGLRFHYGVRNIPHDDKKHKGGEDAWVATSQLLAVADGVGGWERHGVDSGLFSKQLCRDI